MILLRQSWTDCLTSKSSRSSIITSQSRRVVTTIELDEVYFLVDWVRTISEIARGCFGSCWPHFQHPHGSDLIFATILAACHFLGEYSY